jgi:hypothetical protein
MVACTLLLFGPFSTFAAGTFALGAWIGGALIGLGVFIRVRAADVYEDDQQRESGNIRFRNISAR